jgi:ribonuclease HI
MNQDLETINNNSTNTSFVVNISAEKRRLKDLKYSLYIFTKCHEHKGKWMNIIINSKHEKQTFYGSNNNTNIDRISLYACLEGMKLILSQHNDDEKHNCKITIYTDNVYCINILKEWIHIWKKTNFLNRPNNDLLIECYALLNLDQVNIIYQNTSLTLNDEEAKNF